MAFMLDYTPTAGGGSTVDKFLWVTMLENSIATPDRIIGVTQWLGRSAPNTRLQALHGEF